MTEANRSLSYTEAQYRSKLMRTLGALAINGSLLTLPSDAKQA
jgi:hypothetical protein